jgi:hypothetical protein
LFELRVVFADLLQFRRHVLSQRQESFELVNFLVAVFDQRLLGRFPKLPTIRPIR